MKPSPALVSLLLAFGLLQFGSSQTCSDINAEVIIIGAGMSGISAAKRLQDSRIANILVLEASSRIGGRMRSMQFGGATLNLGASYISGIDPAAPELHPVYELAQMCGGLRGTLFDSDSHIDYDSQGGTNFTGANTLRYEDYDTAVNRAGGVAEMAAELTENGQCAGVSFREGLSTSGWNLISPEDGFVDWINSDLCQGEPPEDTSLCAGLLADRTYNDFVGDSPGAYGHDETVTDPEGYVKLPVCVANTIQQNSQTRVQLDSKVTEINWGNEDCVCVTTAAATYCAKYAISTVSVGVLKSGQIQFVPELPQTKHNIIQRFAMARELLVFIEFSEVFWDNTSTIGHVHENRGYYPFFYNFHKEFPENPKVLMTVLTGAETDRILAQPEADTIAEIEQIFNSLYPDSNVQVLNILIPDWVQNELFLGSWSHRNPMITPDDPGNLASPINNLYFSGEGTSRDYSGYVHGAILSGRATADSIILVENTATTLQISMLAIALGTLCAGYLM